MRMLSFEAMVRQIHEFEEPLEYLREVRAVISSDGKKQRPLSAEQWARRLGYRSRRTIGMVLSGRRLPSADMLERISQYLNHSILEHRYLQLLFQRKKSALTAKEREHKSAQLLELKSLLKNKPVTLSSFAFGKTKFTQMLVEQIKREVTKCVLSGKEDDSFVVTVTKKRTHPNSSL